jgi:hypothetical protein
MGASVMTSSHGRTGTANVFAAFHRRTRTASETSASKTESGSPRTAHSAPRAAE